MFNGVIWIQAEIHEVNKHGELSGNPLERVEKFPLLIEEENKEACLEKLNYLINEMKKLCQS